MGGGLQLSNLGMMEWLLDHWAFYKSVLINLWNNNLECLLLNNEGFGMRIFIKILAKYKQAPSDDKKSNNRL